MKFDRVYRGAVFYVDGMKSYPKLKTDYGYIDMRDKIKVDNARVMFDEVDIADFDEIKEFFECSDSELQAYIGELLSL